MIVATYDPRGFAYSATRGSNDRVRTRVRSTLRLYLYLVSGSAELFASYRGEIATNRDRLLGSRAVEFGVTSRVNQREPSHGLPRVTMPALDVGPIFRT